MVYKCVCYQLIASWVQINSSVPILKKKKKKGGGGAELFNYFFPIVNLPTEGAEETLQEEGTPKPAPAARWLPGTSQGCSRMT